MATSTYKTYLMYKPSGSYTKLLDIKSYPDLGGSPELLETTTLSDAMRTNILGIQSNDSMEFTCNYDKTKYTLIKGLSGTQQFAIFFGSETAGSASDGTFYFSGEIDVHVNGGEVNAVREMTVTIAASTPISTTAPA